MGQFATPTGLAVDILRYTKGHLTGKGGKVCFIDPALGTGSSNATAANVYLMLYPRGPFKRALLDGPELKRRVWEYLNQICP